LELQLPECIRPILSYCC